MIASLIYIVAIVIIISYSFFLFMSLQKKYEKRIKENQEVYSKLCCDLHDICKKSNESLKELTVKEIKNAHDQFITVLQNLEQNISKKIESNEFDNKE